MHKTPKVALLIETARGHGRGMLRGIVRYARLHGPWAFYVSPGDFVQALPEMEQWGGRMRLFHKDGDYEALERVLTEGFSRYPVDRRADRPPIHLPRSRPAAEDVKQSVMSPFRPAGR